MAASFQAKDSNVLNQQLKVQELVVKAGNPLVSVSGSDLIVSIGETLDSVLSCQKQLAAGGAVTALALAIGSDTTTIKLTGESAALATTTYVLKYVVAE
jgi:hypothetical protein